MKHYVRQALMRQAVEEGQERITAAVAAGDFVEAMRVATAHDVVTPYPDEQRAQRLLLTTFATEAIASAAQAIAATPTSSETIPCPCCKGSGLWNLLATVRDPAPPCNWCRGAKVLSLARALEFAQHVENIAEGGYIAGESSSAELYAKRAEMRALREQLREIERGSAGADAA